MLSCSVVRKTHYFSHNLHYYNNSLPSLTQTTRLVPGLMKARLPENEMCCDWLAVPVRCDCRTDEDCVSVLPRQFEPDSDPENIEQEDRAEPLHARILQDINNKISPFGVDFEIYNFVNLFMPKNTHYTLTKIKKVKKHNRTPWIFIMKALSFITHYCGCISALFFDISKTKMTIITCGLKSKNKLAVHAV